MSSGAICWSRLSDNGPGIQAEEQARIWEKFYRGSGALLSPTRGNGLGLAVVKNLVELHGGAVGLRSALGEAPPSGSRSPSRPRRCPTIANWPDSRRRLPT